MKPGWKNDNYQIGKTMYLLDSDILIFLCKGKNDPQERISRAGVAQCLISEISLAEMLVGAYKSGREKEFHNVGQLEKLLTTIPVSRDIIDRYAQIRAELETQGMRIGSMDLFIAATALVGDYTLVTHNTRHFSRIPGLKLEDWIEE